MAWSWTKLNSTFTQRTSSLSTVSSPFFLLVPWPPPLLSGWEVIAEDETKEIESQGSIPGFAMSPGISGYKQGHFSSGMLIKTKQELQRRQVLTVQKTILQRLTGQSQKKDALAFLSSSFSASGVLDWCSNLPSVPGILNSYGPLNTLNVLITEYMNEC